MKKTLAAIIVSLVSVMGFAEMRISVEAGYNTTVENKNTLIQMKGFGGKAKFDFPVYKDLEGTVFFDMNKMSLYNDSFLVDKKLGIDSKEIALGVQYDFSLSEVLFIRPCIFCGVDCLKFPHSENYPYTSDWFMTAGISVAAGARITEKIELFAESGWQYVNLEDYKPFNFNIGISYCF